MSMATLKSTAKEKKDTKKKPVRKRKTTSAKKKHAMFESYTKVWVSILMIVAVVDMQFSYILAFLGHSNIAETLSITAVTEIIGVMLGYMAKSFFETASERKDDLERKKLSISNVTPTDPINDISNDIDDEECEG